MASDRHRDHLNQYLKTHKNAAKTPERRQNDNNYRAPMSGQPKQVPIAPKSRSSTSERSVASKTENAPRNTSKPKPLVKVFQVPRGPANFKHLPDELLLEIFSYMGPSDLLSLSRVCRRWLNVTNDNFIWRDVFNKYVKRQKSKAVKVPEHPAPDWWRSQCLIIGAEQRNRRLLPLLKKVSQYTKLPANTQKILTKSGIKWQLTLIDSDSIEHTFQCNDTFYFAMSVTTRWYSLEFPPLRRITRLKVHSLNPVFYDQNGKAHENSPCQRSLFIDTEFKWHKISHDSKPIGSDDLISVYNLPHSMMLATWKDGGEMAFISLCIHSNHLVERCFHGSSQDSYVPPSRLVSMDDIDPRYGLHDYSCTIELRNQRAVLWSEHFRGLNSREPGSGGAVLIAVDPDYNIYHHNISKKLTIPWKTDLFKNVLQDMCILDLTVLEERDVPIWCVSTAVKVAYADEGKVDFEFDGIDFLVDYEDPRGKVHLCFNWDGANKLYNVTNFKIHILLDTVNSWFGTKYK